MVRSTGCGQIHSELAYTLNRITTFLDSSFSSGQRGTTRESESNLMFLKPWLDALPMGVEVLDRGPSDRKLNDKLSDTMDAVINISFGSMVISIGLYRGMYTLKIPESFPCINDYLDVSDITKIVIRNLDGVAYNITKTTTVSPSLYMFETRSLDAFSGVLLILNTIIINVAARPESYPTPARNRPASTSTPAQEQVPVEAHRVQAPVIFSETLEALKRLTPRDLHALYLGHHKQKLLMELINTCKVEAEADGTSYKVKNFTFNPFDHPPPRPLDNMFREEGGHTYFCIDFGGRMHRYLTTEAKYDTGQPGVKITISSHEDMRGLWLALADKLDQFRTANIRRYEVDYDDPDTRDRMGGPVGTFTRR